MQIRDKSRMGRFLEMLCLILVDILIGPILCSIQTTMNNTVS